MVRVRRSREEGKALLLNTALNLFKEKGYNATSVQDIVDVAGVSKSNFFYYFPTKDDVLRELFSGYTQELKEKILNKTKGLNALDRLSAYIRTVIEHFDTLSYFHKVILEKYSFILDMVVDKKMSAQEILNDILNEIINQGISEGTIHPQNIATAQFFFKSSISSYLRRYDLVETNRETAAKEDYVKAMFSLTEALFGIERGQLK
ncbi:TetR/AcrR family transcriptional regulator [Succinivibrio dextrinosolvens]|uniref:TetR/AcrR family transcriptional regulator n=1 Tax=Succinivibrio dextrinosolvens TaxID=83771 RepID=UPI00241E907D|nr:TetR/AcrR family transcriptional regulator [Succinivibrio dextrinosolvens]MBE6422449.1 TetR/AcrR family transcriptional regulator [Succinivibrio dextrinosolvens]